MSNRRWRRHYLLMHSPSGIYPLPVEFWLTFPERGVLTCYEFGMLRSLILEKVAPKQFHDKEMEGLRTFYPGDMGEDMLERMVFKPWLELWLKHLEWYIKAVSESPSPVPFVATSCTIKYQPWTETCTHLSLRFDL